MINSLKLLLPNFLQQAKILKFFSVIKSHAVSIDRKEMILIEESE